MAVLTEHIPVAGGPAQAFSVYRTVERNVFEGGVNPGEQYTGATGAAQRLTRPERRAGCSTMIADDSQHIRRKSSTIMEFPAGSEMAHGQWLAERLPQAQAHLLAGEGHLTLVNARIGDILDDLGQHAARIIAT